MKRMAMTLAVFLSFAAHAAPEKPRRVTLDVKDAEARDVLMSMKKQCGIKNLIVDPGVKPGKATFILRDVPCDAAFRVVLRTYGLTSEPELNSVITVRKP